MKLSKIVNQFNKDLKLNSITIERYPHYFVCSIFRKNTEKSILRIYRNIIIDIDIPETDVELVKHLGVTRRFHLNTDQYYINLCYY